MLILMGLRGSGKSTVGRLVAAQRAVPFVDLDDETPGVLSGCGFVPKGATVSDSLKAVGESAFRGAEAVALEVVFSSPGYWEAVLALGGGTPTGERSRLYIGERLALARPVTTLVYLRAAPATLAARLSVTDLSQRPSLTGRGVVEEIGELFEKRDPLYRSLATRVIEVDSLSPEQTAALISD